MSGAEALPGREAECERLVSFLAGVCQGVRGDDSRRVLLIEGESGVGKSALLAHAAECALAAGVTVVRGSGVEAESTWPFALLNDLLAAAPLAKSKAALSPARQHLLESLMSAHTTPPGERAVAEAVVALFHQAAESVPVVLLIDDLHWADTASATVVRHVLRQSHDRQIALIGTSDPDSKPGHFTGLPADGLTRIVLGGLSLGAVAELLKRRLNLSVPRRLAVQLHEACGGNPRYALELARAGLMRHDNGASPRPMPASLAGLVEEKIASFPARTRRVLLAAALLGDPRAELVSAATDATTTLWSDLDVAEREGIARWADGRLAFSHPLVRSVIARNSPASERRAMHRRLADVVTDIEERARHNALAAEGYDEHVADLLDEAVEHASQRGARQVAADLSELAVAQTPPDSPNALARMVSAARHLVAALDLDHARAMLEQVVFILPAGPARAVALGHLAAVMRGLGEPNEAWAALVRRALSECDGEDAVAGPLHIQLAVSKLCARELPGCAVHVEQAASIAESTGDKTLAAQVNAARAMLALMKGEDPSSALGLALELGANSGPPELRPHITAVTVLRHRDDLDGARTHAEDAYRHVLARGVDVELPSLLWNLIELEVWAGRWQRAEVLLDRGWELARWSHSPLVRMLHSLSAATLHAHQGKLATARNEAEEARALAERAGYPLFVSRAVSTLGFIELSAENNEAVNDRLNDLAAHVAVHAMGEPGLWRLLPDEVEALARLGRLAAADALLAPFESRAHRLDRRWAKAAAARCRALIVLGSGGDPSVLVDEMLELAEDLGMPFEKARALLVASEINRRMRRRGQARDLASAAHRIFQDLGASVWAERAERELKRGGVRTSMSDCLSPVERQVASLVVAGLSNREIAARAFMAVRTVEAHLTVIYRKLGVRSRTQLATAFEDESSTVGA